MINHKKLKARLVNHGINISKPGFYDDDCFIKEENKDPNFIVEYARFVISRQLEDEYTENASNEIPIIANIIHNELITDGRIGACIDIGMIFSKILEKEGYWNFQVKGSLTIDFKKHLGIETKYFWSYDITQTPFVAAHSWIVVPPYIVADLAIKQQPYNDGNELLPSIVLCNNAILTNPRIVDVFSPEYIEHMKINYGIPVDRIEEICTPDWFAMRDDFAPNIIKDRNVTLRYTPIAIAAPDNPFEKMKMWRINGRYGYELYNDLIVPALKKIRSV